jgi:hypothetical protein
MKKQALEISMKPRRKKMVGDKIYLRQRERKIVL